MHSKVLLLLTTLLLWHVFAFDGNCQKVALGSSCDANKSLFIASPDEFAISGKRMLVQRATARGIGMIEAEDLAFSMATERSRPNFGLLLIQVILLMALLAVVLLISNIIRESVQEDNGKDQAFVQSQAGLSTGLGGQPRANDDFKMPSKAPRLPPPKSTFSLKPQEGEPVASVALPLNRSVSLPAQPRYPSYGSPNLEAPARVPMLNLPAQSLPAGPMPHSRSSEATRLWFSSKGAGPHAPSMPVGLPGSLAGPHAQSMPVGLMNLDAYPAWAALGTHSSMDSSYEEGTWSNSRPSTLPRGTSASPPRPPDVGLEALGLASMGTPPTTGPIESPLTPRSGAAPGTSSPHVFADESPPRLIQQTPSMDMTSMPAMTPPIMLSPPIPPESQQSTRDADDRPVLLQWYPQQDVPPPPGTWSSGAPMRTRSLSPVPSCHDSRSSLTPKFGPSTPSFTPPPDPDAAAAIPDQSLADRGQPSLRPAANFLPKTASQAGFEGVDGIVQWFNLATPRPGFVPSDLAPLEDQRSPPKKPSRPPNNG